MADGSEGLLMVEALPLPAQAPTPDDLEWAIGRVLDGDVDAFEILMARTEDKILAVAWRLLGDRELARDAAQEAYLRAFRSLDRYRRGEEFQAWLYRIAVNACWDLARKRGPIPVHEAVLESLSHAHLGGMTADHQILEAERRDLVRRGLSGLTPAERSALVLRDLQGLTTEETARVLGVRAVTVRSQISSARAKLQAYCRRWMGGRP